MEDLIKEMSLLVGYIENLWEYENETVIKLNLLKLNLSLLRNFTTLLRYKNYTIDSDAYHPTIQVLKETKCLVNDYKQKTKDFNDILEHVMRVTNAVSRIIMELIEKINKVRTYELSLLPGDKTPGDLLNVLDEQNRTCNHADMHPCNKNKI